VPQRQSATRGKAGSNKSLVPIPHPRILGHPGVGVTEVYYAHLDLTDLAEDADLVMVVRRWEEGP
jgi:hypothetical protein